MRQPAVLLTLFLLAVSGTAHANGALPDATSASLSVVDVEMAVAATPHGSTRWSRISVDGSSRAMWLVPVRPGAALDWASDAWLEALDDATAVRVVPPELPLPCSALPTRSQRAPVWTRTGPKRSPSAMTVQSTESALREHAGQRGFAIQPHLGARLASLYARGWSIVTFELDPTATQRMSSPTLRVSDDGAAELPFALVESGAAPTRLTAFTITHGPATVAGAREISPATIVWGTEGSNYARLREDALSPYSWVRASTWLRESSSHEVLFDGVTIPNESEGVAPLTRTYFASASCKNAARTAASSPGTLGRVCAAGKVARIPGGSGCAAASGTIDSRAFVCENGGDDLVLALSESTPRNVFVSRFVGQLPAGTSGADDVLSPVAAPRSPRMTAEAYDRCPNPTDETPLTPPPPRGAMPIPVNGPSSVDPAVYTSSEGCSGSASSDYYEEDTSEGCSVDTSSGDDGDDDTSGDDSSWDDGSSSSDDSESEDDSSDSSDSDDESDEIQIEWGDDDSEDESWQSKAGPRTQPHGIKKPSTRDRTKKPVQTTRRLRKRESSPVSRMALLFGALVLPFRRRQRSDVT